MRARGSKRSKKPSDWRCPMPISSPLSMTCHGRECQCQDRCEMHLIAGTEKVPPSCRGAVVAIGNFDGVHRGHQKLLEITRAEAERLGKPWGVVTFEPHPRTYF